MEKRKTVSVQLEVYEDKVEEFKALLHLLKSSLTEESIELARSNYNEPALFDSHIKAYLEFIRNWMEVVFIPSIDSENPVPTIDLMPVPYIQRNAVQIQSDEESSDNKNEGGDENSNNGLLGEIQEFIKGSKELPHILSPSERNSLAQFIFQYAKYIQRKKYFVDDFWECASKYHQIKSLDLPYDLRNIVSLYSLFGYRLGAHVISNRKTKMDDYRLVHRIHDQLLFDFEELKKSDYQARVITGYICHFMGIYQDKETFNERSSGGKNWREYLAANVKSHLERIHNQ